jgi:hypothetical protein
MKNFYVFILAVFIFSQTHSQNIIWQENFGSGCNQGQIANVAVTPTNGAWSVASLNLPFLNGPEANEWFISSSEQGQLVGICGGITCGGSNDRTLHIGRNKPIPPPGVVDVGASYFGGSGSFTNKRAATPVIDLTGTNFVQLSFKYILGGVPGSDFCDLEYSADGGNTWNFLINLPQTNNSGCGLQGLWTMYAVGLPVALSNNANVKLGFHWYNNDPTGGSPSVAIDNIYLSELSMATTNTVNCVLASSSASVVNNAQANTSYTWTSSPNTATFSAPNSSLTNIQFPSNGTYTLYVMGSISPTSAASSTAASISNVIFGSTPMVSAVSSDTLLCTGNSAVLSATGAASYTWNTSATTSSISISPTVNTSYTVTGKSGYCISTYTIIQQVDPCTGLAETGEDRSASIFPNPFTSDLNFSAKGEMEIQMTNMMGEIVREVKLSSNSSISTSDLPKGMYFLTVRTGTEYKNLKLIKN